MYNLVSETQGYMMSGGTRVQLTTDEDIDNYLKYLARTGVDTNKLKLHAVYVADGDEGIRS